MYHRPATERALDLVAAMRAVGAPQVRPAVYGDATVPAASLAERIAGRLLAGSTEWTRRAAPLNDCIPRLAPSHEDLTAYARALGVRELEETPRAANSIVSRAIARAVPRKTSGDAAPRYGRAERGAFRVLFDADEIGARHVPGHAHADTLQVLVWVGGHPLCVDTASSTYAEGERRAYERSTRAHNTVTLLVDGNALDSSEMWGSFRVGRRARIKRAEVLSDTRDEYRVRAEHDGYRAQRVRHMREVVVTRSATHVRDELTGGGAPKTGRLAWVIAPDLWGETRLVTGENGAWRIVTPIASITILGADQLTLAECEIATGFEMVVKTGTITANFENRVETIIEQDK
jgi:hypothetical protein